MQLQCMGVMDRTARCVCCIYIQWHWFLSTSGEGWVDTKDPNIIAETELLQAAASIEAAAKKLSELRPRRTAVRHTHTHRQRD